MTEQSEAQAHALREDLQKLAHSVVNTFLSSDENRRMAWSMIYTHRLGLPPQKTENKNDEKHD